MGCVHIYYGDGKGKTTAAIGQGIRGAGSNMNVLVVRLLKTENSSELAVLRAVKGIYVYPIEKSFNFYSSLSGDEKNEAFTYYNSLFEKATAYTKQNSVDMVIFDEILDAIQMGIIKEENLIQFIDQYGPNLEIILTGRNPSETLVEKADYISEMVKHKHPFDKGIKARKGIEY
ncbi:MAG: cob(I)yrinic acid a,c-diamide adenosyltransferase [Lachnospiraceae bacterium]